MITRLTTKSLVVLAGLALAVSFISCEKEAPITDGKNALFETESLVETPSQVIPNQYIVTLKEGSVKAAVSNLSYDARLTQVNELVSSMLSSTKLNPVDIKQTYGFAVTGFTASLTEAQLAQLQTDDRIASIEPDYIVSINTLKEVNTNAMAFAAQQIPYGITRVNGGVDATGKTAWIIDTGIDLDHPDLNVDVKRSRSFVPDEPSPDDGNGHGSHVAGTVGAKDNDFGVIGVAPNANLVALKVLSSEGSGATSGIIAALDYVAAVGQAGDAANMSLGPLVPVLGINSALDNATNNVGALGIGVAIAAGNSTSLANLYSPARASGPNVFTVSAMDRNDQFAYFSNYGSVVDYCAPGVGVFSTSMQGGYATLSGTSMAAPHLCGLLLLGDIRTDGRVFLDPDLNADPIAVH